MTGPCKNCGHDPGFPNWVFCTTCGARADGQESPQAGSNPDRWERTIIEQNTRAGAADRARFGDNPNFYRSVTPGDAPGRLKFGSDAGYDPTVADTGETVVGRTWDGDDSDHTVIDRGGRESAEIPDSDRTIISREGRKGVTGPLVYLVERNGIRAGKAHLLRKETAIGRVADDPGDIVLGDDTVSKRHAKVRLEDEKFVFWDLASTNHSFVVQPDGTRKRILEPHPLKDGDCIDLGDARLTYVEVDSGAAD